MVIEWLIIRVPSAEQANFITQDAAIWTPVLAAQPGFAGKEVWRAAQDPETLNLVIRWASLADWKSIPADLLSDTDARFQDKMGVIYPVLECVTYDVLPATG